MAVSSCAVAAYPNRPRRVSGDDGLQSILFRSNGELGCNACAS